MNRILLTFLVVGCATTAPAPTRPAKSYSNVFVVNDVGHDYTLRWPRGLGFA